MKFFSLLLVALCIVLALCDAGEVHGRFDRHKRDTATTTTTAGGFNIPLPFGGVDVDKNGKTNIHSGINIGGHGFGSSLNVGRL